MDEHGFRLGSLPWNGCRDKGNGDGQLGLQTFYLASQVITGLAGIAEKLTPVTPSDTPYEAQAEPLPKSLMESLDAFRTSAFYEQELGKLFVDYLLKIKDAEVARFLSEVTDWEHKEYFDMF